ncbi:MAG: FRG domain-containing protein [bacterium]|jgi:hypothetical protein
MNEWQKVKITSSFAFLREMYVLRQQWREKENLSCLEYYRGHADAAWRLLPVLYRTLPKADGGKTSLAPFESGLVQEFWRTRPEEFSPSLGMFNVLAKMQHYGLPTRLMDLTSNPAVALFFACCSYNRRTHPTDVRDGEVIVYQTTREELPNIEVLNIIADFCVNRCIYGDSLREFYDDCAIRYPRKRLAEAFAMLTCTDKFLACPQIISERISRQKGFFILFTGQICPKSGCRSPVCPDNECPNRAGRDYASYTPEERLDKVSIHDRVYDPTDYHYGYRQDGKRYIVDGESKLEILDELDSIGINEAFLFPELQYESKRIVDDYLSRIN